MKNYSSVKALIPARGGSKGIPNKNITPLLGKPLIAWTIEAALKCHRVDEVYVSTDSPVIAAVATCYGAKVIVRPGHLAQDHSLTDPVIAHAIDEINAGDEAIWVLLQPTSPLRQDRHIDEALDLLLADEGAQGVLSVYEESPALLKAYSKDEQGYLYGVFGSDAPYSRRQDLPVPYMPNGAIYAFWQHAFKKANGIPRKQMLPYIMPHSISMDIDDHNDLLAVEHYLGKFHD